MFAGQNTRIAGQINQTVPCVVAGKLHVTAHLKANIVQDLSKLFHTDCIAGQQLYNKLMDTASTTSTSKEDKARIHINTKASKQISGSRDNYTNISAIIANDTIEEISSNKEDEGASVSSFDADVAQYFAMQTDEARAQAVLDYPELASCLQSGKEEAPQHYPPDPVPSDNGRQEIGLSEAYINSIRTYPQTHKVSSIHAGKHEARQIMVDSTPSALSYHSTFASNLVKCPQNEQKDDTLSELIAQHGYHDDSLDDLMASHGYGASAALDQDPDQVSLHSDTAEYFCRLCQRSDQPDIVTFSHNLLDPYCPSMMYEYENHETDSDVSSTEEDDDALKKEKEDPLA